jgi:hypothetical protein
LYRTPLTLDSHFYALARNALIILAQLPAVLIIAAAFVLLVDPVLIISVVTRMVLLCMQAQRPKSKQRDETWCGDTRYDEIWLHAASPVLELSALRARLPVSAAHRAQRTNVGLLIPPRNFGSGTFRLSVTRAGPS